MIKKVDRRSDATMTGKCEKRTKERTPRVWWIQMIGTGIKAKRSLDSVARNHPMVVLTLEIDISEQLKATSILRPGNSC